MPRINSVTKARKDQGTCRCGTEINRGDAYKWIQFRYGPKVLRCSKCAFRNSDLTQSKLAGVWGSIESAEDSVAQWDGQDVSDLSSLLEGCASEVREVAEEYNESADAIEEQFSESPTADECREKADALESFADELDEFEFDDFDKDDETYDDREEWKDAAQTAASDMLMDTNF